MPIYTIDNKDEDIAMLRKMLYGVINKVTRLQRDMDFANAKLKMFDDKIDLQDEVIRNARMMEKLHLKNIEGDLVVAFRDVRQRMDGLENILKTKVQR